MPTEEEAPNLFIPIWTRQQSAVLSKNKVDSSSATFVPFTQYSCDATSKSIPKYWPKLSYQSLKAVGDDAVAAWRSGPNARKDGSAPVIWRAAREGAYINRLLDNFRENRNCGKKTIGLVWPDQPEAASIDSVFQRLPFYVLNDYARSHGLEIEFLQSCLDSEQQSRINQLLPHDRVQFDTCVLVYAIPDLGRVVSECASKPGHTLFIATPDSHSQIDNLRQLIDPLPNVSLRYLSDGLVPPSSFGPQTQLEALEARGMEAFGHMTPYSLATFCAFLEAHQSRQVEKLKAVLTQLIESANPAELIFANHNSPYTQAMHDVALNLRTQVTVLEHSLWPLLKSPFELPIDNQLNGYHRFYTRSAMVIANKKRSDNLKPALQPWSTLQVDPRRKLAHRIRRSIKGCTEGLRVGVVVTTGQAHVAPDVSPEIVFGQISRLCALIGSLKPDTKIVIRMRDSQDSSALLIKYLQGQLDQSRVRQVTVSGQSDEPFLKFVRPCHRIVEVGVPTSATYEAFMYHIPAYRLSNTEADDIRFLSRPLVEIDLEGDATSAIQRLLARKQTEIIRQQSAFFEQEISNPAD